MNSIQSESDSKWICHRNLAPYSFFSNIQIYSKFHYGTNSIKRGIYTFFLMSKLILNIKFIQNYWGSEAEGQCIQAKNYIKRNSVEWQVATFFKMAYLAIKAFKGQKGQLKYSISSYSITVHPIKKLNLGVGSPRPLPTYYYNIWCLYAKIGKRLRQMW